MEGKSINRAALGSSAYLGDLYDARRDDFCGISIFKRSIPTDAIQLTDANFSDIQLLHSDDVSEKFAKLNVSAELQVSVLGGLFSLEGSGRYLSDKKESARSAKCSLIYNVNTKDEFVNIFHEDLNEAFAIDAIESGVATHVVVGVSWGANSILSCMYENRENQDTREIAGSLSATLKKACLSISGSASVEFTEHENKTSESFDIRLFGDLLADNEELPTNFEGALQLIKKLPKLVASTNNGKGKPLTYKLLPLSLLQNYLKFAIQADQLLQSLEEASLARIVNFFEQMASVQQEVNDFYQDAIEFKYCVKADVIEDISKLTNELTIQETSLRSRLADVLTQVRSGQKEVSTLEKLLEEFQSSEISPKNVQAKLTSYTAVVQKLNFARALTANGAKYIGLGSALDDELLSSFNDTSYILYFSEESKLLDTEEWNGNRQLFLQELKKKGEGCKYYVVDWDIHPDRKIGNYFSCIQVMQKGQIVVENLLKQQTNLEKIPFVQYIPGTTKQILHVTGKRTTLSIRCTGINCKPDEEYEWVCKRCKYIVDYGFDNHVYCKCGQTPAVSLEFRCPDPNHGINFERHEENYFSQLLGRLREFKETNILILGETGVGKSTFINGFVNFMTYASLDEAEAGDLRTLIPSEFTVCNDNFEQILVSTGTDKNEVQTAGQSATQGTKVYPFRVGRHTIRFIDTPGIGDTRGIEQDKKNFENILATISNLDELHGILILLKPNNARLNVMFRFCITELLTHLHKDASKNIVFCFTNSRGTFYRPGDTLPALKNLLAKNENVEIPLSKATIYCFDSEAYRFLAAIKNNPPVTFLDHERQNFANSWDTSLAEISRLMQHIWDIEPHKISSTVSLNQTRQLVLKIARPLAEINQTIQQNKVIVEREKEKIEATNENIEELSKHVMVERLVLQSEKIPMPKTVCGHSNCISLDNLNGQSSIIYERNCHNPCKVRGVQADVKGPPGLINCWAFCINRSSCRICGHNWQDHLHIYYESKKVLVQIKNEEVVKALKDECSAKEKKQKLINAKNKEIEEYDQELKQIENASVRFASFLKTNAITPYNDAIEQYLTHLIQEEESLVQRGADDTTLKYLKTSMESYQEQKQLLEQSMSMGEKDFLPPSPKEIQDLIKLLEKLKHSGNSLKEAISCVEHGSRVAYSEAVSTTLQCSVKPTTNLLGLIKKGIKHLMGK